VPSIKVGLYPISTRGLSGLVRRARRRAGEALFGNALISQELHRRLAEKAAKFGTSLNQFIVNRLRR
jgi:HicB family